ncbi:Cell cycle serine/threonine-protein kinase cdc5/MSD2 [Linnemannia hyalina]|uniref:non-specific serine/threonine protein kinase n=1 Tax=Linnemannia hyalina TaxID=64524 RepID=A0A9P7XRI4_9FUNG|nr:Cell cycle serine/threonine-protein kinase cdc5/MSD2 [Linnemannia hyalina]
MDPRNEHVLREFREGTLPLVIYQGTTMYTCDTRLGEGAYGSCYKAATEYERCVLKISHCPPEKPNSKVVATNEAQILSTLSHPYIVQSHRSFEVGELTILVLDLYEGGDLHAKLERRLLKENILGLPEADVSKWMWQVLEACLYLHNELGLVHRDLKPANVLLDDHGNARVADFGFSFYLSDDLMTGRAGTPGFCAPEVLAKKKYGEEIDVFSYGVMVRQLLYGIHPVSRRELEGGSVAAARLINDCMKSQYQRVSFAELREYEFFARWRNANVNGKRPLRSSDTNEEPKKRLALSPSSVSASVSASVTPNVHAVASTTSHCHAAEAAPELVEELAGLPHIPIAEDPMPFWMALITPDPDLVFMLAVAQMDPLNDPLSLAVGEDQQELTDFGFLDQLCSTHES